MEIPQGGIEVEIPQIEIEKIIVGNHEKWVVTGKIDYVLVAKTDESPYEFEDDAREALQQQWEGQLLEIAAKIIEKWGEGLNPLIHRMTDPEKWWKSMTLRRRRD